MLKAEARENDANKKAADAKVDAAEK